MVKTKREMSGLRWYSENRQWHIRENEKETKLSHLSLHHVSSLSLPPLLTQLGVRGIL